MIIRCSVLLGMSLAGSAVSFGQEGTLARKWRPTLTLQTGFASTFQLTLGGTFGRGPAWQNRVNVDFKDTILKGDAISLSGFTTVDNPTLRRDWTAGVSYRARPLPVAGGSLVVTGGWQRWLFPSVLGGARDHLLAFNGSFRDRWKFPVTISVDNWTLVKSPLRKGNLTHAQFLVAHTLMEAGGTIVVLRHGPSTAYSHHFYDRPGWRVLRYGGSLAVESREFTVEATVRQQGGVAPGVVPNTYWAVMVTRRL